jgi:acyl dehydratase
MGRIMHHNERFLEDYQVGEVFEFGDTLITAEEIIAFASKYDPQPFHLSEEAGRETHFGGLSASGWMTCSIMMRQLVDHFISRASSMGSPGIDELRWTKPVKPGDRLSTRVTITEVRPSRSKPDRGALYYSLAMLNQKKEEVLTFKGIGLLKTRS